MIQASEMLFFNEKLTAQEAEKCGLVTKVFPHDTFEKEVAAKIKTMAELPIKVRHVVFYKKAQISKFLKIHPSHFFCSQ